MLLAPTGRGKTALLIHWLARLQAAAGWTAIFAPISRRYQTATAEATLGMLASALAAFHHEAAKLQVYNTSPDQLRPLVADYLRREPSGGRLVVVLDGLDEAVGWDVGRDLFPRTMGPHLRVVASARRVAHKTRDDWLEELGWRSERTCDVPLPTLIREDVADILRRMGNPLATLATDVDLLGEITRVSEGDPLTVRLLVEALQDRTLTPGHLTRMPPGLEPYFRSWLQELMQYSNQSQAVYDLLGLCATALGPLASADLHAPGSQFPGAAGGPISGGEPGRALYSR